MKKILFVILLSAGSVVQAQQNVKPLNLIKGWWVIESNSNFPKKQTVKFYNVNQELIYQEFYNKKILKLSKKRIRNMLDSALVTVLKTESEYGEAINIAKVVNRKQ